MEVRNEKEPMEQSGVGSTQRADEEVQEALPKKKRKKWPVVVGVVAVAVIAAGAGFMVWHEQPSFCSAICHSPMDPYVEGYYSDDANLMAVTHRQSGVACLGCHEPVLSDQIQEATKWVSGDFVIEGNGMLVMDAEEQAQLVSNEKCKSCHDFEEVKAATVDFEGNHGANPHDSHVGELACSSCHQSHEASTLYCGNCHSFTLPEGWEYPKKE